MYVNGDFLFQRKHSKGLSLGRKKCIDFFVIQSGDRRKSAEIFFFFLDIRESFGSKHPFWVISVPHQSSSVHSKVLVFVYFITYINTTIKKILKIYVFLPIH